MKLAELLKTYNISGASLADFIGLTRGAFNNKLKVKDGKTFNENEKVLIRTFFDFLKEDLEAGVQFDEVPYDPTEVSERAEHIKTYLQERLETLILISELKKTEGRGRIRASAIKFKKDKDAKQEKDSGQDGPDTNQP
ncbi:hypothetical protein [Pontibacter sp. BAB1700]|uniref:hypothetical protein n=1 Tax=Pontibacter sp. BAB1700 TaxID=1144253 RepID=UPI00026BE431|nr:hypothetical protein [Pontibacter sp. BAB1700]EJF08889.1 hypothetical protein O71_18276 [Pontibacter sp. BAB1700]